MIRYRDKILHIDQNIHLDNSFHSECMNRFALKFEQKRYNRKHMSDFFNFNLSPTNLFVLIIPYILGIRLFARQTFTTPKIRTFTTPKFRHLPPPKTVYLPGGQLPRPIFFLFLAHFSWLFRLTAH